MAKAPVATIAMPRRIPHGSTAAGSALSDASSATLLLVSATADRGERGAHLARLDRQHAHRARPRRGAGARPASGEDRPRARALYTSPLLRTRQTPSRSPRGSGSTRSSSRARGVRHRRARGSVRRAPDRSRVLRAHLRGPRLRAAWRGIAPRRDAAGHRCARGIARRTAGEEVVIVSHGAALGIAMGTLLDRDPRRWQHYHLSNAGCPARDRAGAPAFGLESTDTCSRIGAGRPPRQTKTAGGRAALLSGAREPAAVDRARGLAMTLGSGCIAAALLATNLEVPGR